MSSSPVASTSKLPASSPPPHQQEQQQEQQSSPPRRATNLRRISVLGDTEQPRVHVDLARPERALTAERLQYLESNRHQQQQQRNYNTSSLATPHSSSGSGSQAHATSFVDLFVGKRAAARHNLPPPTCHPPYSSAATAKDESVLEGPAAWFHRFVGTFNPSQAGSGGGATVDREPDEDDGTVGGGDGQGPASAPALLDEADRVAQDWHVLKDAYQTPKLPLVFCHGLFGFDKVGPEGFPMLQVDYWRGIRRALEQAGVQVLMTRVPASASIEERARTLCEVISTHLPGREINLIGHSMGGLDARLLVSHLKPKDFKVRSITTVATPHRGSAMADYFVNDFIGKNNMPMVLNVLGTLQVPGGGKAFEELTTSSMARFNDDFPNVDGVSYFSYGARCQPSILDAFRMSWGVIHDIEGDNDGLVSVQSAMWGKYIGTLENVNHLDLVGWIGQFRYSFAEWTGKPIQYRPASFYLSVSEMLAKEGF